MLPLFLALYFLVFLLSENVLQSQLAGMAETQVVTLFFAASLFCLAGGYLGLACCRQWRPALLMRLAALGMALLAVLFVCLPFAPSAGVLCSLGVCGSFCLGGVGGLLHWATAWRMAGSAGAGRLVGWSIGGAVLVQFLVERWLGLTAQCFVLATVSIVLAGLFFRRPPDLAAEPVCPGLAGREPAGPPSGQTLGLTMLGVGLMSVIFGVNEGIVTTLNAQGQISVTDWPRLCYAGALVLAGHIADIRRRAYMPVVTLCALMLSTLAIFLLDRPEYHVLNLALLYFYGGFYVVYFTVVFLALAARTPAPALWAGMGRICRSLCAGAVVLGTADLSALLGQGGLVLLNTLLLAALCAVFFWSGQLGNAADTRDRELGPDRAEVQSQQSAMLAFAEQHTLTRRETEVLTAVLSSQEPLSQIANELHLSERVLQRHLTAIYGKSGVTSRMGLLAAFYGQP